MSWCVFLSLGGASGESHKGTEASSSPRRSSTQLECARHKRLHCKMRRCEFSTFVIWTHNRAILLTPNPTSNQNFSGEEQRANCCLIVYVLNDLSVQGLYIERLFVESINVSFESHYLDLHCLTLYRIIWHLSFIALHYLKLFYIDLSFLIFPSHV